VEEKKTGNATKMNAVPLLFLYLQPHTQSTTLNVRPWENLELITDP
jgi:hypothetical protein